MAHDLDLLSLRDFLELTNSNLSSLGFSGDGSLHASLHDECMKAEHAFRIASPEFAILCFGSQRDAGSSHIDIGV